MRLSRVAGILFLLLSWVVGAAALDRDAFTFTNYQLGVRFEPAQQRLAVRGKITLRNDSAIPQKNLVLQVSSSLDWRSIEAAGKPVQFVSQPYASDIDHTGGVSEAVVTLAQEVAPKGTVDLEIGYEGTVGLDIGRLKRVGIPDEIARHTEWDQISPTFTALRGVGHVVWYPVAMQSADFSDGNSLFQVLGRWKAREAQAEMKVSIVQVGRPGENESVVVCDGKAEQTGNGKAGVGLAAECSYAPLRLTTPTLVLGNFEVTEGPTTRVYHAPANKAEADAYVQAADRVTPFVQQWLGTLRQKAQIVQLPDSSAAPFESGTMLLSPLNADPKFVEITLVHQLAHAAFSSSRPWVYEGVAHFAQAVYREQQSGRQAALDYMGLHLSALAEAEKSAQKPGSAAAESLINTSEEEFYRSKAMFVWWMLRDMVGEASLKKALAAYRPQDDKEPSYIQHLIEAQSQRDLEWFFDDWVYRDRGLPDFRIASVYPRKTLNDAYVVTVTVENLGEAGAEVPVSLRAAGGDGTKRLEVREKSTASIRIEIPSPPEEAVVNDGSVPESEMGNNSFKVETVK
jgi:hypothetical protein